MTAYFCTQVAQVFMYVVIGICVCVLTHAFKKDCEFYQELTIEDRKRFEETEVFDEEPDDEEDC